MTLESGMRVIARRGTTARRGTAPRRRTARARRSARCSPDTGFPGTTTGLTTRDGVALTAAADDKGRGEDEMHSPPDLIHKR
jgi:hypothetical protein